MDFLSKAANSFNKFVHSFSRASRLEKDKSILDIIKNTLHTIVPELKTAKGEDALKVPISAQQMKSIKTLSHDALALIKKYKLANIDNDKSLKDIFYNFFGMNEKWPLGRNLLGGFMVHFPEYPTYFLPAYNQTKATGDAGDLKKGEGARGLITGGLEGVAVGALVSGRFLKVKEMVPYIILGASLQLLSSKLFPWLGEKMGGYVYRKRMSENPNKSLPQIDIAENRDVEPLSFSQTVPSKVLTTPFKGICLYNKPSMGSLKI